MANIAFVNEKDEIIGAGKEISDKETLEDILSQHEIGEKIELKVFRKGKNLSFKIQLGEYHKSEVRH